MAELKTEEEATPEYVTNIDDWLKELNVKKENLIEFLRIMKPDEFKDENDEYMFSNLEQSDTVSSDKPNISFGDRVMIINPLIKTEKPKVKGKQDDGVAVSVMYLSDDNISSADVCPGMFCGCTSDILPNSRNTFCIEKVHRKRNSSGDLTFGEDFSLSISNGAGNKFYLECLPQQQSASIGQSQKVRISLVSDCNDYCRWKILHTDPAVRKMMKNQAVLANLDVIIVHSSTNQNLCALDCWIPTKFGQELELTVETREDHNSCPLLANVWQVKHEKENTWEEYLENIKNQYVRTSDDDDDDENNSSESTEDSDKSS